MLGNVVDDVDSFAYYLDMRICARDRLKKEHKERLNKEDENPLSTRVKNKLWKKWMSELISEWLSSHPAPTWRLVMNALSWMGRKNPELHRVLSNIYKSKKFFPGKYYI